jgi:hypothetical protein
MIKGCAANHRAARPDSTLSNPQDRETTGSTLRLAFNSYDSYLTFMDAPATVTRPISQQAIPLDPRERLHQVHHRYRALTGHGNYYVPIE